MLLGNSLRQMVHPVEPQRLIVESVQKMIQQLMDDKDRMIERIKAGHPEDAMKYIESEKGRLLMLAIREEMAKFDRREVQQLQQALASSSADRSVLMGVVVWGGSLALILLLIPLHLIARSITGPLTSLAKAVEKVSGGTLPDIPVFQRHDEIGELTRMMQTMGTQIRNHIRRIEQSEQELRTLNHDLTSSEAKYRGIVDYAPIGIFTANQLHLIFSNRQNWILAGRNPETSLDPEVGSHSPG